MNEEAEMICNAKLYLEGENEEIIKKSLEIFGLELSDLQCAIGNFSNQGNQTVLIFGHMM